MPAHIVRVPVRFGDCDPAGIAYFPSILHLLHGAFEVFWEEGVGIPYPVLMGQRRRGFPTARLETDFREPLRYGDLLEVALTVEHVGTTSAIFLYRVARVSGGGVAVTSRAVTVCVDMDTLRPVPVPDDVRSALKRFQSVPS
jgi:YbgC/YbaW family acyl-CoA thioester hydrolase